MYIINKQEGAKMEVTKKQEEDKITLTKKQERVLRKAIYNWIDVLNLPANIRKHPYCTLCNEYLDEDLVKYKVYGTVTNTKDRIYSSEANECEGCPVFVYTGENRCKGTPDTRLYANVKNRLMFTINFGNKILKKAGLEPCNIS